MRWLYPNPCYIKYVIKGLHCTSQSVKYVANQIVIRLDFISSSTFREFPRLDLGPNNSPFPIKK